MKNSLKLMMAFFIGLTSLLNAQEGDDAFSDIDKYKSSEIATEFNERFKKDSDKKDFKRLREFLREKEDLLDALKAEKNNYYDRNNDIKKLDAKIAKLLEVTGGKKGKEKVAVDPSWIEDYSYGNSYYQRNQTYHYDLPTADGTYMKSYDEINEVIAGWNTSKGEMTEENRIRQMLERNVKLVKQDIYDCRSQIDSALAPEYKQQEFRTTISIYFTILIGILLFVFFFIVYKKSGKHLSRELLSGNGLQFITLFVLIIAVILFGILSILQSSELAAILSGISGYILGKGVPKKEGQDTDSANDNNAPAAEQ